MCNIYEKKKKRYRDTKWKEALKIDGGPKNPTERKKKKKVENSFIGNMEASWMIELK